MSQSTHARSGALVLLGGEGLGADSDQLWYRFASLAPNGLRRVVCLPTALAGQKIGTVERRSRLILEHLAELAGTIRIVEILNQIDASNHDQVDLLEDASAYLFFGGKPRVLASALMDTPAWITIQSRHDAGVPVVAAGGAAAGLGSIGVAPSQSYPADRAGLLFEPFAGLGLLPDSVVLPYLSWLPRRLVDHIRDVVPTTTRIIGLDDQAALIWDGSQWGTDGLGNITLWRADGPRRILDVRQPFPDDWLPPHRKVASIG